MIRIQSLLLLAHDEDMQSIEGTADTENSDQQIPSSAQQLQQVILYTRISFVFFYKKHFFYRVCTDDIKDRENRQKKSSDYLADR